MNDPKLGSLIDLTESRDAIHIAIAAAVAGEALSPGEHIGVIDGEFVGKSRKPIGIVDPFLKGPVKAGDRFWMLLYPGTITSLRHDWTHPAFVAKQREGSAGLESAKRWLQQFADDHDESYGYLLDAARNFVNGKESSICFGSDGASQAMYDDQMRLRFWECFSLVTGIAISHDPEDHVFRCAC